jgi:hypothetical protein
MKGEELLMSFEINRLNGKTCTSIGEKRLNLVAFGDV